MSSTSTCFFGGRGAFLSLIIFQFRLACVVFKCDALKYDYFFLYNVAVLHILQSGGGTGITRCEILHILVEFF